MHNEFGSRHSGLKSIQIDFTIAFNKEIPDLRLNPVAHFNFAHPVNGIKKTEARFTDFRFDLL
ncbi:MAG: hypothetical protein DWQ10_05230 [Calditrichaeota bacterium]|nr:MAG: hypothetical protein DWQ10_05230 [Calditrichota bacterium]